MLYIAALLCVAGCALAAPADTDVVPLEKQQPTVIPIVSQSDELEPNGTYKFSYETGNGIKREETSYDKVVPKARGQSVDSNEGGESGDGDSDEIHVQQGSYSYTAPDGTLISVRYIADENGFQPIGDHIPRVGAPITGSSAEKSGRALKADDSAAANSAPAPVAAKPDDKPEENAPEVPKLESRSGESSAEASTPAPADVEATTKADEASASITEANTSDAPSSSEASSSEVSTTEATKASETPEAPVEVSTTEAAKSSEVTEAASTPASEASTPPPTTTEAASTVAA